LNHGLITRAAHINVKGVKAMQEYFRAVGRQTGETPAPVQFIDSRFVGKGSQ
jgi:hypothetical protein